MDQRRERGRLDPDLLRSVAYPCGNGEWDDSNDPEEGAFVSRED